MNTDIINKGERPMPSIYYQVISNTVFEFVGPDKELKRALDCPNNKLANKAKELLDEAFDCQKVASLVEGVWKS